MTARALLAEVEAELRRLADVPYYATAKLTLRWAADACRDAIAQPDSEAADAARLREALADANGMCRSAHEIARRIATDYSTVELGTRFGAFADRLAESLKRQHAVMYPRAARGEPREGEA